MARNTMYLESDIKQRVYKVWNMRYMKSIPRHAIDNLTIERFIDHMADEVMFKFDMFLASEEKKETKSVTANPDIKMGDNILIPRGVWQTIKHFYAPKWFLKYFPVKYIEKLQWTSITNVTNITNNITVIHPEVPVPMNHMDYFVVQELGPPPSVMPRTYGDNT